MYKKSAISLVFAIAIGGCAGTQEKTQITEMEQTLAEKEVQLARMQEETENLRSSLKEASERSGTEMRRPAVVTETKYTAKAGEDLLPPNAKPGECYSRVLVPERYETKSKRVLKNEKSERVEVIPARYETVKERVLVKEADVKKIVIPAKYAMVNERVLVREATKKKKVIPARFGFEKDPIEVCDTKMVSKVIPAKFEMVNERVLIQEVGDPLSEFHGTDFNGLRGFCVQRMHAILNCPFT
ncbi:MAG: V-type ATPase 116kDa subunit family protein, partial [Gammaproteobacteria bacterium]|nr:V-type ATPase 116kDa subunit family protein [Gammaproteobacteria bacterium]